MGIRFISFWGSLEINAMFSNPTDVSSYVDDDTTQYPIPEELIPMVVQNVLQLEFNVMLSLNAKDQTIR